MSSINSTQIDGSVSVGRNAAVGGDVTVQGKSQFKGNVKVEGWLEARNIRDTWKGLFTTEEKLEAAYPLPRDGWWALVGTSLPAAVYVAEGGEWIATGEESGITVDGEDLGTVLNDKLLLDLGEFSGVDAFTEALGTEEVIRSGKSLVVGRSTTSDGYESLYLCIQAINVNSGTGRQYVFANNSSSTDDVNGWRVRSINGVKSGSYTLGSWEKTMPHRFWLNSNRYIEVGDYSSSGSGTGNMATVDLSGIFSAFSVSNRTAGANTLTATIAGLEKSFQLVIATTSYAGLMSATDKAKLDGIEEGATKTDAVLDLGSDFDGVDAFTEALGTEAVIRSGKSIVTGKRVTEDGYESLFLCLQSINVISGTGRQYVFSNNNDGTSAACGWRVRSINGVKSGSYSFSDWVRAFPQKFWLNSNRYLAVGEMGETASGEGDIANVDLYNIFSAFSASRSTSGYTVTSTVAGRSRSATLAVATSSQVGLMSAADKEKLDGLTELPVEAAFDAGTGIGMELTADSFDPVVSTELSDVRIQYCGGVVAGGSPVGGHRFFLVGTDTDGKTVARSTWADNAVAGRPGSWAYNADSDAMGTARLGVLFKLDGTTTRYYVDAVDTTTLTVFTQPTSGSSGGSSGGELTAFSISQSTLSANFSITVGDNTLTARLMQVTSSQAGLMRASDYTNLNDVVKKATELEEEITAIKEDMGVTLPAVVSFDGIGSGEVNSSQSAPEGIPTFYDTYEAVTAQEYDGDKCTFTPTGVYWCSRVVPYTNETTYGEHRFFLVGTLAVPHTSSGTSTFTVAVKTWEDGDVSGYLGSWAYNEDDDAYGYARTGVLFQATDGTLYYRAYENDSVLTELELGADDSVTVDTELDTESENPVQNKTIAAAIAKINAELFPLTVTVTGGGTYETGTTQNVTVSWTTKQGSESVTPDSVTVNDEAVDASTTSKVFSGVASTTTYTVKVTKDGSTATGSVTARFVNASYYGVVDADFEASEAAITALTKSVKNTKSLTAAFTLDNQKVCYAYPSSFGALTSIKDGNNFDYINSYTRSEMTIGGVSYYVYVLTDATTVESFTQTYA